MVMPALLTSTSTEPNVPTAASKSSATELGVRHVRLLDDRAATLGLDGLPDRLQSGSTDAAGEHDAARRRPRQVAGDGLAKTPARARHHRHMIRHSSNMSDILQTSQGLRRPRQGIGPCRRVGPRLWPTPALKSTRP